MEQTAAAHLTPQTQIAERPAEKGVTPSSTFLRDRLREQKAQSQRVNKTYDRGRRRSTRHNDDPLGADGKDTTLARQVQSSPVGGLFHSDGIDPKRRATGIGTANGSATSRSMGARETEEVRF